MPDFRKICAMLVPVAALLAVATLLCAAVRIGGSSFRANGQIARDHQYTGACPVDLTFDWGVIGTEASIVAFRIARSDGGHGPARSIALPAPNRSVPVVEHWKLGSNAPQFRNYSGWMEIQIESPNSATNRIAFTIHCR